MVQTVKPKSVAVTAAYPHKKMIIIIAFLLFSAVAIAFEVRRRGKMNAAKTLDEAINANSPDRIRAAVLGGSVIEEASLKTGLSGSCSDQVGAAVIQNYNGPITEEILTLAIDQNKPIAADSALKKGAKLNWIDRQKIIKNRYLIVLKTYLNIANSDLLPSLFNETLGGNWQAGASAVADHLKTPCQFLDVAKKEWVDVLEKMLKQGGDLKPFYLEPKTEAMAILLLDQGYTKANFNELANDNKWDNLFAKLYEKEKKTGVFQFYQNTEHLPFFRKKIIQTADIRKDLFDPIKPPSAHFFPQIARDLVEFNQCSRLSIQDTDSLIALSHNKFIRDGILKLAHAKAPIDSKTWLAKLASEHNDVTNYIPFLNDLAKAEPVGLQEALDDVVNTARYHFALACIKLGAKPSAEKTQSLFNAVLAEAVNQNSVNEDVVTSLLEQNAHLDSDPDHAKLFKTAREKKLGKVTSFLCKDLTKEAYKKLGMTVQDLTVIKEEKDCLELDLDIPFDQIDHLLTSNWTVLATRVLDKEGEPHAVFLKTVNEKEKNVAKLIAKNHPRDLLPSSIVNVMKNGWKDLSEGMIEDGFLIDATCFKEAARQGWRSTLQKLCDRNPQDMQQGLNDALETDTVWAEKYSDELCFFLLSQGAVPQNLQATIQKAKNFGWTRVLKHLTSSLDASSLQAMNISVSDALGFCSEEQVAALVDQGAPCRYQDYERAAAAGGDLPAQVLAQVPVQEIIDQADDPNILRAVIEDRFEGTQDDLFINLLQKENPPEELLLQTLEKGASPNCSNNSQSALYLAIDKKLFVLAKQLIEKGADPNTPAANTSPLMRARVLMQTDIILDLLKAGATYSIKDDNEYPSILALAEQKPDLLKWIYDRATDEDLKTKHFDFSMLSKIYSEVEMAAFINRGLRFSDIEFLLVAQTTLDCAKFPYDMTLREKISDWKGMPHPLLDAMLNNMDIPKIWNRLIKGKSSAVSSPIAAYVIAAKKADQLPNDAIEAFIDASCDKLFSIRILTELFASNLPKNYNRIFKSSIEQKKYDVFLALQDSLQGKKIPFGLVYKSTLFYAFANWSPRDEAFTDSPRFFGLLDDKYFTQKGILSGVILNGKASWILALIKRGVDVNEIWKGKNPIEHIILKKCRVKYLYDLLEAGAKISNFEEFMADFKTTYKVASTRSLIYSISNDQLLASGWSLEKFQDYSSEDGLDIETCRYLVDHGIKCSYKALKEVDKHKDYQVGEDWTEIPGKIRANCDPNAFCAAAIEAGDGPEIKWVLENKLEQITNPEKAMPWVVSQDLDDLANQLLDLGAKLTTDVLDQYKAKDKLSIAIDHLKNHPEQIEDCMLKWAVENEEEDFGLVVVPKCSLKVQREQYVPAVARGQWTLRDKLMFPIGGKIADLSKPCNVGEKAVIPLVKAIEDQKIDWAIKLILRGAPVNRTVMQALLEHCEDKILDLISKATFEEGALLAVVEAKKFELATALIEAKKASPIEPNVLVAAAQNGLDWFNSMRAFVSDDQLASLPNIELLAAIMSGNEAFADKVLAQNVDIYAPVDKTGYNAFDYAVLHGQLEIAKKLLDVETSHYKASKAADRVVVVIREVEKAVKKHKINLLDPGDLTREIA